MKCFGGLFFFIDFILNIKMHILENKIIISRFMYYDDWHSL